MLTRFQSSALAIRPPTGWKKPGRIGSALMGIKRRTKNFLARPGIQKSLGKVGRGIGTGVGWARGVGGAVRKKAGFSASPDIVHFASVTSKLKRSALRPKIRRQKRLLRRLGIAGAVGGVGALGLAYRLNRPMRNAQALVTKRKTGFSRLQNLTEFGRYRRGR
jgi:hypothetical protein